MPPIIANEDQAPEPPRTIRIPDPVVVRDLAAAMKLKPYEAIRGLMDLQVYVTASSSVDFATAAQLCAKHGVVARPTI
jgi:translation initiation factor IF-2